MNILLLRYKTAGERSPTRCKLLLKLQASAQKFKQLRNFPLHKFRLPVSLNVLYPVHQEQFLVLSASSVGVALLSQIEGVGIFTGHHEQWHVDQVHVHGSVEGEQGKKGSLGVDEAWV